MEENKDLNPEVDVEQATGTEEKTENKTEEKLTKKEKKLKAELEAEILKYKELAEKTEKARAETEDKYMRVLAEYDNFRKRTAREKDAIYSDAYGDALKEILPIMDTLEMAVGYTGDKVAEGVKMTLTQFKSTLDKLGIEEIPAQVGGEFDPELHNAVMSMPNPEVAEGAISAILRKGYKKGDKVFRYTMVAVNN
jgi:molecular chaperone GrpE